MVSRARNIECSFGCVAGSVVLLKPNVANIHLYNYCEQKFIQHGPTIDHNGLSLFKKNGPIMSLYQNPQCMRAGFLCLKCDNFAWLHTCQDQNELHLKRFIYLPKSASSQAHLAKRKRIQWSIGFNSWTNWTLYGVIPKKLWKLMLMAFHSHFLPQQQYSRVYALFLAFQALVYRWGCQFFSLFF